MPLLFYFCYLITFNIINMFILMNCKNSPMAVTKWDIRKMLADQCKQQQSKGSLDCKSATGGKKGLGQAGTCTLHEQRSSTHQRPQALQESSRSAMQGLSGC
jgi:hypothetical protein